MPLPVAKPPSQDDLPEALAAPRRTLAMRIAERRRQRELRAERLARLRAAPADAVSLPTTTEAEAPLETASQGGDPDAGAPASADVALLSQVAPQDMDETALEDFLRALTRGLSGDLEPVPDPLPGEILHFQRPGPAATQDPAQAPGGLDRLAGAGPGLIWALHRAGIRSLADVAALEESTLAARLGPLGRLIPAGAWIKTARAVEEVAPQPA